MNCYVHEQKSAIGTCTRCGKFICEECNTEIQGKNYCKNCIAKIHEEGLNQSDKNRTTAAIFALLLGGIGAHKFYLGNVGLGILYLLFCWSFIPGILALIEGITFLTQSDEAFNAKYGKPSL